LHQKHQFSIDKDRRHHEHQLIASYIIASALMLPIAGYTEDSDADRSSPKTFAKDSAIATKIKAELAEEKLSTLVHSVSIRKRTVW